MIRTVLTFGSHDYKQRMWERASRGRLRFVSKSRRDSVFALMLSVRSRPDALLFRYLNDRRSGMSTAKMFAYDVFAMSVAKLRGIPVLWIAHNLDAESKVRNRYINAARRFMVSWMATKVFVTEDSLMPYIDVYLPSFVRRKVDVCSFGRVDGSASFPDKGTQDRLAEFASTYDVVGVSLNNWLPKKRREIDLVIRLAEANNDQMGNSVGVIVGGPQVAHIARESEDLYDRLSSFDSIFLIDGWVSLKALRELRACDFVLKAYDDLSMSLGLAEACSLGIPILSDSKCFIGELVQKYPVGAVVSDAVPVSSTVSQFRRTASLSAYRKGRREFFRGNSWERGAMALLDAIDSSKKSESERQS